MSDLYAYGLLMVSAFLSATLLPGSSEAVLVGLLAAGQGQPAILVGAASFGNIAGAAANWLLGRYFSKYGDRDWFPGAPDTAAKTRLWFDRYGAWSLLLSWLPVIGDPLTLVAGLLRVGFSRLLSCSFVKIFARRDDPAPFSARGIVDVCGAHGWGQSLQTTVDHTLMRGLGTA